MSDIYTLGTLLYEILTGQKAHRFSTPQPPPTELLRVVAHNEPVRPSPAATSPAAKRRLRGDLDTIILKALRKEPARRYAGIGAFAMDIRRYLENRPVTARKDSLPYRASKFIQRNKLGTAAAALVLVTLLDGIAATTGQMHLARKERARAERRFNEVRGIANSLMLELHDAIKNLPGAMTARQLITQRALEYLDSLAEESGTDLSLKSELATAYEKIGLVTFDVAQAINSHRKAATLDEELVQADPKNAIYRRQLSASYRNLGDVFKISGNSTQSIEYARKSLEVMHSLATDKPGNQSVQLELADRHLSLALCLTDAGDFNRARESVSAAMQIQQELLARTPADREMRRDLGGIYRAMSNASEDAGDYDAALKFGRKSLEIAQEFFGTEPMNARPRRDLWAGYHRAGRQLALTGDLNGALENETKAIELIEGLASADPADKGHRRWLSLTYLQLGEALAKLGRTPEALKRYSQAVVISDELFWEDPGRIEAQRDLARICEAIGLVFTQTEQTDRALENLNRAKTLAESCAAHDPHNARIRNRLAAICRETGALYWKFSTQPAPPSPKRDINLRAARSSYQRSLELWTESKNKGMLNNIQITGLDDLAAEITKCDVALNVTP